nr:hypothetical protein [uncultured Vibrio sp.]
MISLEKFKQYLLSNNFSQAKLILKNDKLSILNNDISAPVVLCKSNDGEYCFSNYIYYQMVFIFSMWVTYKTASSDIIELASGGVLIFFVISIVIGQVKMNYYRVLLLNYMANTDNDR